MKAYSHEKHAKKIMEQSKRTKSSDPWARSGERPGWGHGSELFGFFVFFVSKIFAIWPKPRENQKNKKNKKFRPMGKVWGEAWQGTWV